MISEIEKRLREGRLPESHMYVWDLITLAKKQAKALSEAREILEMYGLGEARGVKHYLHVRLEKDGKHYAWAEDDGEKPKDWLHRHKDLFEEKP